MNAKKCDRCGYFYLPCKGIHERENAIKITRREKDSEKVTTEHYDLCPKCMESLEKWLKEGEQNG